MKLFTVNNDFIQIESQSILYKFRGSELGKETHLISPTVIKMLIDLNGTHPCIHSSAIFH